MKASQTILLWLQEWKESKSGVAIVVVIVIVGEGLLKLLMRLFT